MVVSAAAHGEVLQEEGASEVEEEEVIEEAEVIVEEEDIAVAAVLGEGVEEDMATAEEWLGEVMEEEEEGAIG